MLKQRGLYVMLILCLAVLSCNLQSSVGTQGFAATLAAIAATQTAQAGTLAPAASASATVEPSATPPTPTASPTATLSPSPTASNTPITPPPHIPAPPEGLQLVASCLPVHLPGGPILYKYGIVVRWTDNADNESAYVVDYAFPLGFNGAAPDVKEINRPANAASDSQEFGIYAPGVKVTISVFARNAVGESVPASGTFTCP